MWTSVSGKNDKKAVEILTSQSSHGSIGIGYGDLEAALIHVLERQGILITLAEKQRSRITSLVNDYITTLPPQSADLPFVEEGGSFTSSVCPLSSNNSRRDLSRRGRV